MGDLGDLRDLGDSGDLEDLGDLGDLGELGGFSISFKSERFAFGMSVSPSVRNDHLISKSLSQQNH